MKLEEINDYELIELYKERDENARNILYDKYGYIIDVIINKHKNAYFKLGIEESEFKSAAMLGFSDALDNFREDKDTQLKTFISICINRRLHTLVRKYKTLKHQLDESNVYLDDVVNGTDLTYMDTISDDGKNDPLGYLEDVDRFMYLDEKINDKLSPNEKKVYDLLLNGFSYKEIAIKLDIGLKSVDNTIQRIKTKIKTILDEET